MMFLSQKPRSCGVLDMVPPIGSLPDDWVAGSAGSHPTPSMPPVATCRIDTDSPIRLASSSNQQFREAQPNQPPFVPLNDRLPRPIASSVIPPMPPYVISEPPIVISEQPVAPQNDKQPRPTSTPRAPPVSNQVSPAQRAVTVSNQASPAQRAVTVSICLLYTSPSPRDS